MNYVAGVLLQRPPNPQYTKALQFAELTLTDPLPKPKTLAQWKNRLPQNFKLALRAPESSWLSAKGALRLEPDVQTTLQWLAMAIDTLQPNLLVIPTGPEVTTGQRDRNRLTEYFKAVPKRQDCSIVWCPSGLWEPDAAQHMAHSIGVLSGFNAAQSDAPTRTTHLYSYLLTYGVRRAFSHAQLSGIADTLKASGAKEIFVTIHSQHAFNEARLLQALLEETTMG